MQDRKNAEGPMKPGWFTPVYGSEMTETDNLDSVATFFTDNDDILGIDRLDIDSLAPWWCDFSF